MVRNISQIVRCEQLILFLGRVDCSPISISEGPYVVVDKSKLVKRTAQCTQPSI